MTDLRILQAKYETFVRLFRAIPGFYKNVIISEQAAGMLFATSFKAQDDLFKRSTNEDRNQLCLIIASSQLIILHQTAWQVISTNGS